MLEKAGKTTFPFLSVGKLEEFYIPVPPINEQKRIVNKLKTILSYIEEYDEKYQRLEKLNNNYKEELKKSILQYAIQGKLVKQDSNDEPAEILINKILDKKRQLIKAKQIKKENLSVIYKDSTDNQFYEKFDDGKIVNITDEIPFEIHDNWCWTRLKNIGELLSGYAYKSNMYIKNSRNLIIRLGNVKNDKVLYDVHPVFITDEIANATEKFLIKENDILITMTGTKNKRDYFYTKLIKDIDLSYYDLYLNQRVGDFRCNTNINLNYIIKILKSKFILDQIFAKETGTANQGNIGSESILNILVPMPPFKEQKRISDKLNTFSNIIETAE